MRTYLNYDSNRLIKLDLKNFGIDHSHCYIYLDYLNHAQMSGNKLRKLYGSIEFIKRSRFDTIITIGGNYSNYLHAISYLPELENINCVCIIKGHEPKEYGYTLTALKEKNIPLYFYSKDDLHNKLEEIIDKLKSIYPKAYFVPEGGSNEFAHEGFRDLIELHFDEFNRICTPVGTLGTYKGIEKFLHPEIQLTGYAAHNDYSISAYGHINYSYSFGGFAKMNQVLFDFISKFKKEFNILLDPIYTSKMMYGIIEDYKKGIYGSQDKIAAIHTGGLQGWQGMKERENLYLELT